MGVENMTAEKKMNPAAKAKWIEALRSGRYKQAKGLLYSREERGYCCLGVLRKECGGRGSEDGYGVFLLEPFLRKVGLTDMQQNRLSEMNDRDNLTFGEIAEWIEANL